MFGGIHVGGTCLVVYVLVVYMFGGIHVWWYMLVVYMLVVYMLVVYVV